MAMKMKRRERLWVYAGLVVLFGLAGFRMHLGAGPAGGSASLQEGQGGAAGPPFDLLLKGGHLIDPANKINAPRDVAVSGGKIARVAQSIPASEAKRVVDVSGAYVTPGLIDLHTHFFVEDPGGWGIYPDVNTFPYGVTTVVDAGTAGWKNFEKFKTTVIDRVRTRVLALLNIVSIGMDPEAEQDMREMDARLTAGVVRKYPDIIVGIKTAHYGGPEWEALDRAFEAAEMTGVPVMVDFRPTPERTYEDLLLKHMRPGDIHTHMYARHIPLLDENGKVNDYMRTARERGILFDVGHGAGSFWFRIGVPAMEQGFGPDSLGTDIHFLSRLIPVAEMTTTLSKFLNMGMELEEVILRATVTPARSIRRHELGNLSEGSVADIAVLQLNEGKFGFVDSGHAKMVGNRKLRCLLTLREGRIVWDVEGLSWPEWREAGDYQVLE